MPYVGKSPADIIATAVDTTTGTFSGDLTVDTNTLFVDSANNRVGVGTSSPDADLSLISPVYTSGGADNGIRFQNQNNSGDAIVQSYYSGTNPSALLHGANIYLSTGASFTPFDNTKANSYILQNTNGNIEFGNANSGTASERMRIDTSGNLLVGKTSATASDVGVQVQPIGRVYATRDGDVPLVLRRNTSDGNIAQFLKDNSTVGAIGTTSGVLTIDGEGANTGGFYFNGANNILPRKNKAFNTGTIDLGSTSQRWKDLYLSGTVDIVQGNNNVAVGKGSMSNNTGSDNTALGMNSLYTNTSNGSNTAIGSHSLYANTGVGNTGVGRQSLRFNSSGAYNTALGYAAGFSTQTGSNSTFIGYQAGYSQTATGSVFNTFVGNQSGHSTTNGTRNSFFGHYSGEANLSGDYNTYIGQNSGYLMTTGNYNTIIGSYSGNSGGLDIRTSNNNIVLSDGEGNARLRISSAPALSCIAVYNFPVAGRDVYVDSNGTIGYQSSIRQSKTNIVDFTDASWLLNLSPKAFNYRTKDADNNYTDQAEDELYYGLIADEVETVNSDLCFYNEVDGQQELAGVSYSKMITPMLKLIQEQQTTITALEARLSALENV